jgi:hypothetical protein
LKIKNIFQYFINNNKQYLFLELYIHTPVMSDNPAYKKQSLSFLSPLSEFLTLGVNIGILRKIPEEYMLNFIYGSISSLVNSILEDEIKIDNHYLNLYFISIWDGVKIN